MNIKFATVRIFGILIIAFIVSAFPARAQVNFSGYEHLFTAPARYGAYRASGPIQVDGDLSELSWSAHHGQPTSGI